MFHASGMQNRTLGPNTDVSSHQPLSHSRHFVRRCSPRFPCVPQPFFSPSPSPGPEAAGEWAETFQQLVAAKSVPDAQRVLQQFLTGHADDAVALRPGRGARDGSRGRVFFLTQKNPPVGRGWGNGSGVRPGPRVSWPEAHGYGFGAKRRVPWGNAPRRPDFFALYPQEELPFAFVRQCNALCVEFQVF